MIISNKLKERFCKECNIPLRLFQELYFTDRLKLYDKYYNTLNKWDLFVEELQKYNCEQDYFEEYNRVKDAAINDIKKSDGFQRFNKEDMNKYSVKYTDFPSKDIFKMSNNGKLFVSIDMRKANFSALKITIQVYLIEQIHGKSLLVNILITNISLIVSIFDRLYLETVILEDKLLMRNILWAEF